MEINKENMFEKFFEGFQAKFIESFKSLGEEKILVRILENQKANKEEYRTYFNCAWEFLQTTEIAVQQAKVEELQTQLSLQRQRVKAFEEELTSSRNYGDELQTRVDAALKLIESWNKTAFEKTTHWTEGYEEGCYHCAAQLEQALKGTV